MPPLRVNRRRFLGYSAAAGVALAQGEREASAAEAAPIRVGVVGVGNRGTALLRTLLEIPGVEIVAVCDGEPKHRARGIGIVNRSGRPAPRAFERHGELMSLPDVDAVVVALPCDLHSEVYQASLVGGKHVYAEKPLGLTIAECDHIAEVANARRELAFHVGLQRRSNPRFQEGVELIRSGGIGRPFECRAHWTSSNGPVLGHGGWLGMRERSGDWMLEQAVHIWDVLLWVTGELPVRAHGLGWRNVFAAKFPKRDVTDQYTVTLEWASGFHATFAHSWCDPADDTFTGSGLRIVGAEGGFDFMTGRATFRDGKRSKLAIHPGPAPDTKRALEAWVEATRSPALAPPASIEDAARATLVGLLVRKAVDERRVVGLDEVLKGSTPV